MLYTSHTPANRPSPRFFQNRSRIGKPQRIKPSRNQTIPGKPSIPIRRATASDFRPIVLLTFATPIRARHSQLEPRRPTRAATVRERASLNPP
jgi:hypothetical protein